MGPKELKINHKNLPAGATPLNPEDLEGLIPGHITTRAELNDAEFKNITLASRKYLLSRKKFEFSSENLFKLHKDMFGKVWKWAGRTRKTEKNIGVKFFKIEIEIRKFLDDLEYWLKNSMDIIEISARSHHRLVYIHPFNNGNGRWARLTTNLLLKGHSGKILQFPEDELLLSTKVRNTYIEALGLADKGDFSKIIKFHIKYITEFNI